MNKIDITKIAIFAVSMSEDLFTMRAESDLGGAMLCTPNTNNPIPQEFIESTVDSPEHIEKMKEIIKLDIVNHLMQCPNDYKNEQGEYHYTSDVYDFSYVVDSYIEQLYEDKCETKLVWVCANCNSDNVQAKMWVNVNTKQVDGEAMEDDDEYYCDDCKGHHKIIQMALMPRAKVIGYQVIDENNNIIHPDVKDHSNVYSLKQAKTMIAKKYSVGNPKWRLNTIWTHHIECPNIMFEGNVR